jgi:hypothetical protein
VGIEQVDPGEERLAGGGDLFHRHIHRGLGGKLTLGAQEVVEALVEAGERGQVPDADDAPRLVARVGEDLGQGHRAGGQRRAQIEDAVVLGVETGHQRDEARVRVVVAREGVEEDVAGLGQPIEGGRDAR